MQLDSIYHAILEQAWRPEAARFQAGEPGFTELAEVLADDLYRLCVEFGVEFNAFKARLLDEVLNRSRVHGADPKADRPEILPGILGPASGNLPMLVFALELMRDDGNEPD
ncbi:MAG: hypothetical protein H6807_14180 [Planctomycetes bacterium]|nr:hypothetical protein [Planctomycetota bacterium]